MLRMAFRTVVALAAIFATSCGPSPDQACTDLAAATCSKQAQCSQVAITRNWGDTATCQSRQKQQCLNDLAAPSTAATPSTVEACAQAYPNWDCESWELNIPPTACIPPAGKLSSGSSCLAGGQCQSTYCLVSTGVECGTCAALPAVGATCDCTSPNAAESCGTTGCGRGLLCSGAQTCANPVADGGSCGRSNPCEPGFDCVGLSATSTAGTCEAQVATAGSPCDSTRQTGPSCSGADALACIGPRGARTCVTVSFASAGQACGLQDGGVFDCSGGAECINRVCVAAAQDGQSCDTLAGPPCMSPARCITGGDGGSAGTCIFPNPANCP